MHNILASFKRLNRVVGAVLESAVIANIDAEGPV